MQGTYDTDWERCEACALFKKLEEYVWGSEVAVMLVSETDGATRWWRIIYSACTSLEFPAGLLNDMIAFLNAFISKHYP